MEPDVRLHAAGMVSGEASVEIYFIGKQRCSGPPLTRVPWDGWPEASQPLRSGCGFVLPPASRQPSSSYPAGVGWTWVAGGTVSLRPLEVTVAPGHQR